MSSPEATKVLFAFGTRPEAIKLVPLILHMQERPVHWDVKVCITTQHREMLWQVLDFFGIRPDFDLDLMKANQGLARLGGRLMLDFDEVLAEAEPELVIVQGDTTSAFLCGLAAFYRNIRVAHIEAGLRSHDRFSPFPEEVNRRSIAGLADYHFAPTQKATDNLRMEGITEGVHVVGNTVIDALILCRELIKKRGDEPYRQEYPFVNEHQRSILITIHRRESFGEPLQAILDAIATLATENPDIQFIWPVHLNPNIMEPVHARFSNAGNMHLLDPVPYDRLVWLMERSHIVITDSGGIQEEAPHLGIPVVVVRDKTERTEAIDAGTVILCGRGREAITDAVRALLTDKEMYKRMSTAINPYGDGKSSIYITEILEKEA